MLLAMASSLGTPLSPRFGFIWALVGCAAFFGIAVVWILLRSTSTGTIAVAVALALGFVVLPLSAAWLLARIRVHVSDAAVSSTAGDRVGQTIAWTDVDSVQVRWEHGIGVMARQRSVTVIDGTADGTGRRIHVSERFFDLGPLLAEVVDQVAARPVLLPTEEDRAGLSEFAAAYDVQH